MKFHKEDPFNQDFSMIVNKMPQKTSDVAQNHSTVDSCHAQRFIHKSITSTSSHMFYMDKAFLQV